MRNMSFTLTTRQFRDGSKTVTRRLGWKNLKAGRQFMGVKKSMGLRPGEKIKRYGSRVVLSNRSERLNAITPEDVVREGFPGMTPAEFVKMFCLHMKCRPNRIIQRIEFAPVPDLILRDTDAWRAWCRQQQQKEKTQNDRSKQTERRAPVSELSPER